MGVLTEIQAEIERELLECESTLLLRQLRQRSHELTFGELKDLLGSPAGRRLHACGLAELFVAPIAASPPPRDAGQARPSRVKRETIAAALLAALHASRRPLTPRELVTAVGHDAAQVQRTLRELRERGLVLMVDLPPRPTYWAQEGGEYTGSATASRNAAEVVAALRAAGRSMALREVTAASGLTEEKVRRALAFLINSGQVLRLGRSVSTRYTLAKAPQGEARPRKGHHRSHAADEATTAAAPANRSV